MTATLPLDQAVATFNAAELACPFNATPSPSRFVLCPKCRATASDTCRRTTAAAFGVVDAARAMLNPVGKVVQ
jgi:hypothetical protein